jgi:hypothetical protein
MNLSPANTDRCTYGTLRSTVGLSFGWGTLPGPRCTREPGRTRRMPGSTDASSGPASSTLASMLSGMTVPKTPPKNAQAGSPGCGRLSGQAPGRGARSRPPLVRHAWRDRRCGIVAPLEPGRVELSGGANSLLGGQSEVVP